MTTLKNIALCTLLLAALAMAADGPERKIVHREEPEYPPIASNMNLHGTVKLRLWIKADGTIRRLEYLGGHPLLADSALKTVKTWTYESASRESTTVVELKF